MAQKVCREVNPDIHVYVGRVVSGDQFIFDKVTKQKIIDYFGWYCTEEKEGGAIA